MKRMLRWPAVTLLAVLACTAAQARSSHEHWLELQSPHFIVVTDGRASQARNVAEHFERIREVFLQMSPRMHVDPPEPVIILAVKNERDLKKLLPGYWEQKGHMHPGGIFVSAEDRNYIALRMDANQYYGYHVVYHEYVHLLESLNFTSLPLWVREGLAEFYAAARIGGKDVALGYPMGAHIALLREGKWIPLEELLTADRSSPLYNENNLSSIFYAESWELTHFLLLSNKGAFQQKFVRYIELYEQGVPSLAAARQTFGDLDQLTKQLASYPYRVSYSYVHFKVPPGGKQAYPSRPISPAEAEAVLGDFYVHTDRPVEAGAALQQAILLNPKLPAPYESLALLALHQRNRLSALKWFDQAIALGSKDYLAYYYRALLSLGQAGEGGLAQVESDLKRCVDLNANFAPGYRLLAEVYANQGKNLKLANGLVQRAIGLAPASSANYLTLGLVLLRQGKDKQAEEKAEKALALAHSSVERRQANDFLRQIRERRAQIAALSRPAQPATPTLVTRPSSAQPASVTKPAPTPASPAAGAKKSASAPKRDVYLIPEASVIEARCQGKSLSLLLTIRGTKVRLFTPDTDNVGRMGLPASAAGADLCSLLEKRHVAVWFQRVHGQPYFGTIIGIDLKH